MATALPSGAALLECLKGELPRLIAAANQSQPPVSAVSSILVKRYGAEMQRTVVRQFIGLGIRALLEQAGYEVSYRGVRTNHDPIFRSGAIYRLRADSGNAAVADDSLDRMMKALRPDQASRAYRALLFHFPHLQDEADRTPSRKRSSKHKLLAPK